MLATFAPELEVYSIDESFLDLTGVNDPFQLSVRMRDRVKQWTGIPISVGLGSTKTLAKVANRLAKKEGVGCKKVDFANEEALRGLPIQDVWGVGRRLAIRLRRIGVLNAWEFAQAPSASIRAIGGVTLERTQRELTGISCLEMEEVTPPRKNTCCSRSFGKPVTDLEELEEAVANYGIRATRKVRSERSLAAGLQVFIMTNRFARISRNIQTPGLSHLMSQPMTPFELCKVPKAYFVISTALDLLIKKLGDSFGSCSCIFSSRFAFEEHANPRRREFVDAVEEMAGRYGMGGVFWGGQGIGKQWKMRGKSTPRLHHLLEGYTRGYLKIV